MSTITRTASRGVRTARNGIAPVLRTGGKGKAARRAAQAVQGESSEERWLAWALYLAKRKKPLPLANLTAGEDTVPLLWGVPELTSIGDETIQLIDGLAHLKRPNAHEIHFQWAESTGSWIAETAGRNRSAAFALECIAWCHGLPWLAARLPAPMWWELLECLLSVSAEAISLDSRELPLTSQLLSGELPLTLSYLFPELRACHPLASGARDVISEGLTELLDGEGLPHCRHLPELRPLMASWTRSGLLATRITRGRLSKAARTQFDYLLFQSLRLTRSSGSQVLMCDDRHAERNGHFRDLVSTALMLVDDPDRKSLVRRAQTGHVTNGVKRKTDVSCPSSNNSQWSEVSILRTDWSEGAPTLTVAYADRSLKCELANAGQVVSSGSWQPTIEVDGATLLPESDWDEVCWFSDDDVDYLELESTMGGGLRVQRQMLLARTDLFFFVADALLGTAPGKIAYECTYPLSRDVTFRPAEETREGHLIGRRRLGLPLPLALPEWRTDPRYGELSNSDSALTLKQSARAQNLYAPLFIDLHPGRMNKPATWRQLTVAEKLQIVPRDVAVGYRIQVGKSQWLLYRSLAPKSSRTVLGQNLSSEFFAARFLLNGETESLVEIE